MKIQAAIFDVDGTLVDSNDFHARAWEKAFHRFGNQATYAQIRQHVGKGSDQLLPTFFSPEELKAFGKEMEAWRADLFAREYRPYIKPFPCVKELFERIKRDQKRVALGTSAKGYEMDGYKKLLGITELVDSTTNAEHVKRSKPYPDLFLEALKELDLTAQQVVVVGDTPWDAQAATEAEIAVIGVLCGGFTAEQLTAAGCTQIFKDPEDLLARYEESLIAQ